MADDSITTLAKQRLKDSLMTTPGMQQPNLDPGKTPYQAFQPPSPYQAIQAPPNPEDPITERRTELQGLMANPSQDPRYRAYEDVTRQEGTAAKEKAAERLRASGDPIAVQRELDKYDTNTQQLLANRAAAIFDSSNQELGTLATAQAGIRQQGQALAQQNQQFGTQLGEQSKQFGAQLGQQGEQFGATLENNQSQFGQTLANRQGEFGSTLGEQQREFGANKDLQNRQLAEQSRQFDVSAQLARDAKSPIRQITTSIASGVGSALGTAIGGPLAGAVGGWLGNILGQPDSGDSYTF